MTAWGRARGAGWSPGIEILRGSLAVSQLVQNTENFHYEFVDLSEATGIPISEKQLKEIATHRPDDRLFSTARGRGRRRAGRTPFRRRPALGETWSGILGWNTHLSRSRSEAKRWLEENFDPLATELAGHGQHR